MPWYRAGTVNVTLNNTTVTGTGTAFAANSRVGDAFLGPDGRWYEVANLASDTVLSIQPAYQGATAAAGTYALAPIQGYVKASADQLRSIVASFGDKMAALGTTGNYDTLPVAKGGTGANDAPGARATLGAVAKAGDTMTGALNEAAPVTLASAATIAIGGAAANTINITGSVAITGFDTIAAGARRTLIFLGAPILTYDAAKLILPGGVNINAAAGDSAEFESLGGGNWKCLKYQTISGKPAIGGIGAGYIDGLVPSWISATSLSISPGSAWVPGAGRVLTAPSLTLSGLSLNASTWYYLYLYDNAGTPAVELVTTAPSATYVGTARTKNGDTTRRFLFAIKTTAANALMRFVVDGNGICNYQEDVTAAPLVVLSAGAATTATVVSCAAVVPVTTKTVKLAVINAATSAVAFIYSSDSPYNTFFTVSGGNRTSLVVATTAAQQLAYGYVSSGGALYLDVQGYGMDR